MSHSNGRGRSYNAIRVTLRSKDFNSNKLYDNILTILISPRIYLVLHYLEMLPIGLVLEILVFYGSCAKVPLNDHADPAGLGI